METCAQLGWAVALAWLAGGPGLPAPMALRVAVAAVVVPCLPELAQLVDAATFLRWHHGPLQAPVMDILYAALAALAVRRAGHSAARAVLLVLLVRAGVHALMACFPGGLPWAWPHVAAREGWRVFSAQDPVPAALLLAALAAGHAASRRTAGAAAAVLLLGIYAGYAAAAHTAATRTSTAALARQGIPPWGVRLVLTATSPLGLRWHAVAADQDEAVAFPVDLRGNTRPAVRLPRGLEQPLVGEVRHDPRSRAWWAHAAVPVAVSERRPDGRVEVFTRDLARAGGFAAPALPVPYDAWTLADEDGRIMDVLLHLPLSHAPVLASRPLIPPRVR